MAFGDDEDVTGRRGSTLSGGAPVRTRSARFVSEDDGELDAKARSRGGRTRTHLMSEALGENEELHLRISLLEEQLVEEKEKNQELKGAQDGERAALEAEVTRLRELYEPKEKLQGKQKQAAMSAIDQMSHDAKMRELHNRIDELHQENDALKHDLQDARAKKTTAEEELDELKRDNKKFKDQIKISKVERDKLTTDSKQLETRLAETQSALRDATERAQRAEAARRALADDLQAESAQMKHKSNGEHARLAVGRQTRKRVSSNHVDSLADELGNSSSWFAQWNDGASEARHSAVSGAGLELTDMAGDPGEDQLGRLAEAPETPRAAAPVALEVGPPPAELRGFIEKKSPSARFMPCRPYQRRLFVLECGRFSWYDPSQDPSSNCCKGSLDFVFNPSVVEEDPGAPDSFSIRPVNGLWVVGGFTGAHSGRVLEFRCCDPNLPRARWLEALKAHAEFGLRSHEAMLPLAEALGRHGPLRSPLLGEATEPSALAAPTVTVTQAVPTVTVTQAAGLPEESAAAAAPPAAAEEEAEPEAAPAGLAAEGAKPGAAAAAGAAEGAEPEDMPVVSAQS